MGQSIRVDFGKVRFSEGLPPVTQPAWKVLRANPMMVKSDEESPCFSPVFPGFPRGTSPWLSGSRGAFQGGPRRGRASAAVGGAAAPSTGCVEAALCELPSHGEDVFFPNSKTLPWSLWPRLAPVRSGAASTPGSGQGSGGFRCRYLVRFRRVTVQILG